MLTHWWLDEIPPVPGMLRLVFYAGLLALCLFDHPSPLDAAKLTANSERLFVTSPKVLRALRLDRLSPGTLRFIRVLTIAAWVCAALGVLQPVTGILTFLGVAVLHGTNAGMLGSNHSTHSALYALFCLCFSVSYDGPSLDRLLAEHTPWPLLVSQGSVFESGFGPTLLLVGLTYIMFAGGVSKVLNGGLAWFDGRGLRYYIEQSADYARAPFVVRAFTSRRWLCTVLAALSVAVELSAPLALLVHGPFRLLFVLAWCALHVGILLVMMPAYYVQMWCYLLVLDWYQIAGWVLRRAVAFPDVTHTTGGTADAFAVFGCVFAAALIVVLLRQVEQWPFTSVPMYSNGKAPDDLTLPTPEELHGRAVRAARGRASAWHRPWVSTEVQQEMRLVPRDGGEPVALVEAMSETDAKFVRWSQYAKVVREVAVADLAGKPADGYALTGPDYPAGRFLADAAAMVRAAIPDWERYERLELVCHTARGWLATGSAPLVPTPRSAAERAPRTEISTTSGRTDS